MGLFRREAPHFAFDLDAKERVLAWSPASTPDGPLEVAATSLGLRVSSPVTFFPWHTITSAQWEEPRLTVVATPHGKPVKVVITIDRPATLMPVVRERVTDTVIVSEYRLITDTLGATFVARRQPDGSIAWSVVLDSGLDIQNSQIREIADAILADLRGSLGV